MDRHSILLIDDNPADRTLIRVAISRRDRYRLLTATDGESGIAAAKFYDPDAIVLDLNLPGMEGEEVITALRADPETAHIPILVLSGDDDRSREREVKRLGAAEFMVKTSEIDDLVALISEAVARHV